MSIEKLQDLFSFALQADLEHGVAWLNDEASARFYKDYPELTKAINALMEIE